MTDQFPDATKKVLSPAAQAMLDAAFAVEDEWNTIPMIAAALEAAADQVVPIAQKSVDDLLAELVELGDDPLDDKEIAVLRLSIVYGLERNALIRSQLLAIAAELRAQ